MRSLDLSRHVARARSGSRRLRRQVARWAAPELEAELAETGRSLRSARTRLRATRAELRGTRAELASREHDLPPAVEEVVTRVREEHLTYLGAGHLRNLAAIVGDLERRSLPGLVVEAGTARGGSAIVLAAAKAPERPMKVYDVFDMIPPPGERDGAEVHARYATIAEGKARGPGGETYYGCRPDLYDEVLASFTRLGLPATENNVELVQGRFEDTLDLHEPVAFAHLDADWYESTMTCLTRIAPLVVPGGRIVLDDYYTWSGCRTAADEFFAGRDEFRLEHRARLHAVRV